jgi:hypothetical protein
MSKTLSRAMTAILFLLLVLVAALLGNTYARLDQAGAPNNASVERKVQSYVQAEIKAEAGEIPFDQAEIYLAEKALTTEQAFKAANPAPITGLTIAGAVTTTTLWRNGDSSMVEADYTIAYNGRSTPVGQMFMLKLIGNNWLIVSEWRITIEATNQPLVPVPTSNATIVPVATPTLPVIATPPPIATPSAKASK